MKYKYKHKNNSATEAPRMQIQILAKSSFNQGSRNSSKLGTPQMGHDGETPPTILILKRLEGLPPPTKKGTFPLSFYCAASRKGRGVRPL
ncbi:hypothetical protein Taro_005496 [Colocasia esculenta]|uniref:Uncharacterized protein n=1 Tax=Colocasia esculenta TaxID=4460 RepID=A0A843TN89_COLES|nr:hypothetical protein [Colocasia esculenta]